MSKLKMLILTVIAAVTVGSGALAAAPSASARPPTCSAGSAPSSGPRVAV